MKLFIFLSLITYILFTSLVACELILTPGPVSCKYDENDLDENYNIESDVNIKCKGTQCTTNGSGVTTSDELVEISEPGTYIVQGSLQGQLRINSKKSDDIHLILDDISIASKEGPAIYSITKNKIILTLIGNNTLSDTMNYTLDEEDDNDKKIDSCLFVRSDLSINGSGSISVTGNYNNAISCKKNLKLISGKIIVPNAIQKGIKSKNSLCVKDSIINITASDSAIKVTNDKDPKKGYAVIDGGEIILDAGNDGIHAETHLTINDGYIDIKNSKEGLEAQMIDILGGEIHILATDDGINGTKIKDKNKKNDDDIPKEPFVPGNNSGHPPPPPPFSDDNTGTDGSIYINIVGGKTYITVQGDDVDGIDSNGVLYIGGDAEVYVSNTNGTTYGFMAALDAEGFIAITGATVITASSKGKGGFPFPPPDFPFPPSDSPEGPPSGFPFPPKDSPEGPPSGFPNPPNGLPPPPFNFNGTFPEIDSGKIYQPSIKVTIDEQTAGTEILVKDSENKTIASYTPVNPYSILLITSPKMIAGQNYTIIAGSVNQSETAISGIEGSIENPPSVTVPGNSNKN